MSILNRLFPVEVIRATAGADLLRKTRPFINPKDFVKQFRVFDVSDRGKNYIAANEGIIPYLYDDKRKDLPWDPKIPVGTPTIGIGHIHSDEGISKEAFVKKYKQFTKANPMPLKQVWALFEEDLYSTRDARGYVPAVRAVAEIFPLLQHQFDALVDVAFNIGKGSMSSSGTGTTAYKTQPEPYKQGFKGLVTKGKTDNKTIAGFFDNVHIYKGKNSVTRCRHQSNKELYFTGVYNVRRRNPKTNACYIETTIK